MGLVLQVLRQLRFIVEKAPASSDSCSSSSRGSSSGSRRNGGSSSDADSDLVFVAHCLLKISHLVLYHQEPMLSAVQLSGGAVCAQTCEQLAAVFQEVEATFRAV
jgi:hypothetical protein